MYGINGMITVFMQNVVYAQQPQAQFIDVTGTDTGKY